jgi:uncharacterized protein DUF4157
MDEQAVKALRPWFPDLDLTHITLVHSGVMSWIVGNVLRQGAMVISPFVFFGKHKYDPESPRSLALLAHELRHIEQYRELGHLKFVYTYTRDRWRAGGYSRNLPLEAGPYALQEEVRAKLEADRGSPRVI